MRRSPPDPRHDSGVEAMSDSDTDRRPPISFSAWLRNRKDAARGASSDEGSTASTPPMLRRIITQPAGAGRSPAPPPSPLAAGAAAASSPSQLLASAATRIDREQAVTRSRELAATQEPAEEPGVPQAPPSTPHDWQQEPSQLVSLEQAAHEAWQHSSGALATVPEGSEHSSSSSSSLRQSGHTTPRGQPIRSLGSVGGIARQPQLLDVAAAAQAPLPSDAGDEYWASPEESVENLPASKSPKPGKQPLRTSGSMGAQLRQRWWTARAAAQAPLPADDGDEYWASPGESVESLTASKSPKPGKQPLRTSGSMGAQLRRRWWTARAAAQAPLPYDSDSDSDSCIATPRARLRRQQRGRPSKAGLQPPWAVGSGARALQQLDVRAAVEAPLPSHGSDDEGFFSASESPIRRKRASKPPQPGKQLQPIRDMGGLASGVRLLQLLNAEIGAKAPLPDDSDDCDDSDSFCSSPDMPVKRQQGSRLARSQQGAAASGAAGSPLQGEAGGSKAAGTEYEHWTLPRVSAEVLAATPGGTAPRVLMRASLASDDSDSGLPVLNLDSSLSKAQRLPSAARAGRQRIILGSDESSPSSTEGGKPEAAASEELAGCLGSALSRAAELSQEVDALQSQLRASQRQQAALQAQNVGLRAEQTVSALTLNEVRARELRATARALALERLIGPDVCAELEAEAVAEPWLVEQGEQLAALQAGLAEARGREAAALARATAAEQQGLELESQLREAKAQRAGLRKELLGSLAGGGAAAAAPDSAVAALSEALADARLELRAMQQEQRRLQLRAGRGGAGAQALTVLSMSDQVSQLQAQAERLSQELGRSSAALATAERGQQQQAAVNQELCADAERLAPLVGRLTQELAAARQAAADAQAESQHGRQERARLQRRLEAAEQGAQDAWRASQEAAERAVSAALSNAGHGQPPPPEDCRQQQPAAARLTAALGVIEQAAAALAALPHTAPQIEPPAFALLAALKEGQEGSPAPGVSLTAAAQATRLGLLQHGLMRQEAQAAAGRLRAAHAELAAVQQELGGGQASGEEVAALQQQLQALREDHERAKRMLALYREALLQSHRRPRGGRLPLAG